MAAHRLVVAAWSVPLRRICAELKTSTDATLPSITLPTVDPDLFKLFLEYLYSVSSWILPPCSQRIAYPLMSLRLQLK
jgi:hypothetical protein